MSVPFLLEIGTLDTLDARCAIVVTGRVAVIGRVRKLAVGAAHAWVDQQALGQEEAA